MSVSTNGQIHYGIVYEEETYFPWYHEDFSGDAEEWWMVESGWKWEGELPFMEDGNWTPGFTQEDPRTKDYFDAYFVWRQDHPMPVEIVNYQSDNAPAYLLAVPGTGLVADWGYPESFEPDKLREKIDPDKLAAFVDFINKYFDGGRSIGWYLTSYWG